MTRSLSIAAGTLLILGACTQDPENFAPASVVGAIKKVEQAQVSAMARKDLEGATAAFAEGATLYMPGFPPARGREAIKAIKKLALEDPELNVVINEASRKWLVAFSGEFATTTYTSAWTHTDAKTGAPRTEQLVTQTTWIKVGDGSWQKYFDINTVNASSAGQ